jgi:hypothetical protein
MIENPLLASAPWTDAISAAAASAPGTNGMDKLTIGIGASL